LPRQGDDEAQTVLQLNGLLVDARDARSLDKPKVGQADHEPASLNEPVGVAARSPGFQSADADPFNQPTLSPVAT
jgi:hypothetical protein